MTISTDTKDKLLDAAQLMIQTRGYNAFSYADLAKIVKIRKPSIHYHYPAKVDLGIAVTRRYRDNFLHCLTEIDKLQSSWLDKLYDYANLYKEVLSVNRICLCAALATDIHTLPRKLQTEIRSFFNDNVDWLTSLIPNKRKETARMIISTLQGGMILAKSHNEIDWFTAIVQELIAKLSPTANGHTYK